jgi:hypothetical protein
MSFLDVFSLSLSVTPYYQCLPQKKEKEEIGTEIKRRAL